MQRVIFNTVSLLMLFLMSAGYLAAAPLTLVYSGNLDGELEPCGCSEGGDLGGMLRRATLLDEMRKEKPGLVSLSSGGLLANESSRDRLKSNYILKAFSTFSYDAVAVQWRDLSFGSEFITVHNIPWVAGNWLSGSEITKQKVIKRDGVEVAFFSWLDPRRSPFREMHGDHRVVSDDFAPLQQAVNEAKQAGRLVVLSVDWPLKLVKKRFDLGSVDILLVRSSYEIYGEPQLEGNTLVLQPGSRGMRLGRVDLDYQDGKIGKWEHQVIPMPSSVANAERLLPWYKEYNAKVKEAYLKGVEVKKALELGESPFVGAEACQECHAAQFETWKGTLHSNAFEKLENVGKAFDPDCIVCHTVGFEKEGYVDFSLTPHLMNVQCENCHGAGREHINSKGKQPVPNASWKPVEMCGQCHKGSHSPDFNFDVYWPKIAH